MLVYSKLGGRWVDGEEEMGEAGKRSRVAGEAWRGTLGGVEYMGERYM